MAKTSKVAADRRRRETVERYAERRRTLKEALRTATTEQQRADAVRALGRLPRDASPTRLRNRDVVDGRPRGHLTRFGPVPGALPRDGAAGAAARRDEVLLVSGARALRRQQNAVRRGVGSRSYRGDMSPLTARRVPREPLWRHLVGDVLRRERQRQGRTLKEVADAARISVPYLSEVERGLKEASSEVLAAAAAALGLRFADVLVLVHESCSPPPSARWCSPR